MFRDVHPRSRFFSITDPGSATLRLKGQSQENCVQAGGDQVLLSSVMSSFLRCLSDPLALIRQPFKGTVSWEVCSGWRWPGAALLGDEQPAALSLWPSAADSPDGGGGTRRPRPLLPPRDRDPRRGRYHSWFGYRDEITNRLQFYMSAFLKNWGRNKAYLRWRNHFIFEFLALRISVSNSDRVPDPGRIPFQMGQRIRFMIQANQKKENKMNFMFEFLVGLEASRAWLFFVGMRLRRRKWRFWCLKKFSFS